MMKKTDFFKKLSELTKISVEELTKAVTSDQEEVEIELADFHVFTEDELNSRDLNSAKAGNKAAVEMAIKEARNKLKEQFGEEFDFQGKTMDNLLEAATKAGEKKAGIKPNEQLIEKDKVIKNLQETARKLEEERDNAITMSKSTEFNYKVDSTLARIVPKDDKLPFTSDEIITLWKRDHSPVIEDGVLTFKKNGEIVRDGKSQNPIPVEAGFGEWLNEKGLVKNGRGRGEDDDSGHTGLKHSDIKSGDDYYKYIAEKKLSTTEKVKLLTEIQKENPNFSLDS